MKARESTEARYSPTNIQHLASGVYFYALH